MVIDDILPDIQVLVTLAATLRQGAWIQVLVTLAATLRQGAWIQALVSLAAPMAMI